MLKDFLKINDHTLTSKVGGIFHDLFTRVGTLANKNNFYTICEKYETFRFKLGLERCACNVSKVFPKNCWIPRDPKNADHNSRIEGEKNI